MTNGDVVPKNLRLFFENLPLLNSSQISFTLLTLKNGFMFDIIEFGCGFFFKQNFRMTSVRLCKNIIFNFFTFFLSF